MSAFQRPRKPRTHAPWTDSKTQGGGQEIRVRPKQSTVEETSWGPALSGRRVQGTSGRASPPILAPKGGGHSPLTPWMPDGTVDVTSVGPRLSRGTCHILLSHGYESVCQRAAERSQGNASQLYEEEIRSLAHRPWRGSGGGPTGCEASAGPASSPAAAPTPTPEERHRASLGAEHPGLRGHLPGPLSAESMLPGPLRASRPPSSLHGPSPPSHPN